MLLKSKLISWLSYITTKLRTDYYNNQSPVHIYVAKLETKTDLYLYTTAELVSEQFSFQTRTGKALSSLEDFNEVEEWNPCLAGLSTSWEAVKQVFCQSRPFQLVFCPCSVLSLLPNSFSISVCVLPPQFVNGLLIINALFEKLL